MKFILLQSIAGATFTHGKGKILSPSTAEEIAECVRMVRGGIAEPTDTEAKQAVEGKTTTKPKASTTEPKTKKK